MTTGTGERLDLRSTDGTPLVLQRHRPEAPARAVLLFSPALGMRAGFYPFFARALAARGIAVYVNEQRGHGEHPWRASRGCDYGYRELVEHDLRTAGEYLRAQHPGLPLILGGHSLGGQLSALLAAARPELADGLLLIASGTTHFRQFAPAVAAQIFVGGHGLFAAAGVLAGHYPGQWFGFGGREARSLMRDWTQLSRTGRFAPRGSTLDYETLLRRVRVPVLSIGLSGDPFAPGTAARALTSKMPHAPLTRLRLPGATPRTHPSNHAMWAREPAAVAEAVAAWLPALPHGG